MTNYCVIIPFLYPNFEVIQIQVIGISVSYQKMINNNSYVILWIIEFQYFFFFTYFLISKKHFAFFYHFVSFELSKKCFYVDFLSFLQRKISLTFLSFIYLFKLLFTQILNFISRWEKSFLFSLFALFSVFRFLDFF